MNALRAGPTSFRVRGRDNTVEFIFDETAPSDVVKEELGRYLTDMDSRLKGLRVYINVGRRLLDSAGLHSLFDALDEHGVAVAEISASQEALQQAITDSFSVPLSLDGKSRKQGCGGELGPSNTLLIRHACRTGTSVRHKGTVVVLGNVNPGAEVAATGDVVVVGSLRGMVHAGADGSEEATVTAISLQATQLRIAGLIATGPSHGPKAGASLGPEVAYIKEGAIVVELYAGVLPNQVPKSISIDGG